MNMLCEVSAAYFENGQIGISRAPKDAIEKALMMATFAGAFQQVAAYQVPEAAAGIVLATPAMVPPAVNGRN